MDSQNKKRWLTKKQRQVLNYPNRKEIGHSKWTFYIPNKYGHFRFRNWNFINAIHNIGLLCSKLRKIRSQNTAIEQKYKNCTKNQLKKALKQLKTQTTNQIEIKYVKWIICYLFPITLQKNWTRGHWSSNLLHRKLLEILRKYTRTTRRWYQAGF